MTARGLRNNNPGNLRKTSANQWVGEIQPSSDPAFCQFDTMAHGIRAIAITLINYQQMHKLRTIREIITRWAPPEENNTSAYISNCADLTGYDPDAALNMTREDDLTALVMAICQHENGIDATAIPQIQYDAGVNLALAAKHL
jgi:hypothetical protein